MEKQKQKLDDALGLGAWLGRKQAFSLMAGKCSAADAECLRKMRDEKKYRSLGLNWETFCRKYLGISRVAAEKIIKLLEEFGTQYFELSAVVRISPEEYRRIAPSVTSEGVQFRGRLLEIAMHNAPELSEAVQELRREAAPPPAPPKPAGDDELEQTLARAGRAVWDALDDFKRAGRMGLVPRQQLRVLAEFRRAAELVGRFAAEEVGTQKIFSPR